MTDSEFHTLCVMTAILRTRHAGREDKAWLEAVKEAVTGFSTLTGNRTGIEGIMSAQSAEAPQSAIVAKSEEVAQTT